MLLELQFCCCSGAIVRISLISIGNSWNVTLHIPLTLVLALIDVGINFMSRTLDCQSMRKVNHCCRSI
eukprot:symbB.v1.2.014094.t1/scaffold1014.1/size144222/7